MEQPLLPVDEIQEAAWARQSLNRVAETDAPVHKWYRFVLSFPPHLVRDYLAGFDLRANAGVLDPFCGTGTTIVEAKRLGYFGLGIEAHPMSHFASTVKTSWDCDSSDIMEVSQYIYDMADRKHRRSRKLRTLSEEERALLLTDSICPGPLNKVLLLREAIDEIQRPDVQPYALLALATCAVSTASNLHFGPEVGVRGRKQDADVFGAWLRIMHTIAKDLDVLHQQGPYQRTLVHKADARNLGGLLEPASIDAVFTSPPYPNEKDYTRTTRLESVLLRFLHDKTSLRQIKEPLLRSNTRNTFKGDDDDAHVAQFPRILDIASEIERRRKELGKTSGFEKLYARVTKLYFGGMARHFAQLRTFLKPGAKLGYVVGDQASFLQVEIPTASILADIAIQLGYTPLGIDTFRTRIATSTKRQMKESVLLLGWDPT